MLLAPKGLISKFPDKRPKSMFQEIRQGESKFFIHTCVVELVIELAVKGGVRQFGNDFELGVFALIGADKDPHLLRL